MADAPIDVLEVLQAGKETTAGTSVAATARVHIEPGSVQWDHNYESVRRRYAGSLATSHGTQLGLQAPTLSFTERVTYDHVVRLLSMSVKGGITGSGGGANKTWSSIIPSDTTDNLNRWTFEVGGVDTFPDEEEFTGCVAQEVVFNWAKSDNEPLKADVSVLAMRNVQAARTGALSMPSTFVEVLSRTARVYIDSGTIGSTSYSRALSGRLSIVPGLVARYGTDGNDYPGSVRLVGPREYAMDLMIEYDTDDLRDFRRAETPIKVRLEFPGEALGGGNYNLRFDYFGKIAGDPIGSDGGVKVMNITTVGEYDSSTTAELDVTVVNTITALP